MRMSLLATTAALALLASPVLAQTAGGPPTPRPGGPPMAAPRAPIPNPLTQEDVSKVSGTTVYGTDDKKIGTIDTVLMNPQSKSIDRLVVKAGGVLGVGGHDVALPVDQFNWDSTREGFRLAKTTDELKAMPEWRAASIGSSAGSSIGGGTRQSGSSGAAVTPGLGTGAPSPSAPSPSGGTTR
jgi:sporulation protein YlmC with PRC-barrel domain